MNDLVYRDWMKFQKSFFRHESDQALVEECIYFFTKAVWPEGHASKSLVVGFNEFNQGTIEGPRKIITFNTSSFSDIVSALQHSESGFDFIIINLRNIITNDFQVKDYLDNYADMIMSELRRLLVPLRYCGIVVNATDDGGAGFPLAWTVAMSGRNYLRLRDEKIGLIEDKQHQYFCNFFQANDDERPAIKLYPDKLHSVKPAFQLPSWTIPKPPPRKKNEILHPAKYPETLVSEFIELFTKEGANVLDPMMGTGSTVIAALRSNRNGFGVDLIKEFVEIARDRIKAEQVPTLFELFNTSCTAKVVAGDATQLNELAEFENLTFDYCITSPPYWSMLSNPGSENQAKRRSKNLRLIYSDNDADLGNVQDYDAFLSILEKVYNQVADKLVDGGYLTVIVKNIKRDHIVYPLAWDIVMRLCSDKGKFDYAGTTFWCQDDVGLKPFAVGIHWVSNTLHQYCLHFRKR